MITPATHDPVLTAGGVFLGRGLSGGVAVIFLEVPVGDGEVHSEGGANVGGCA